MLERVLEPELMDDPDEADSYNEMDHSEVNRRFVEELLAGGELGNDILDLGTGTALIPIELCQKHPTCRVMASDAATSMLDLARYNVAGSSMELRIQLHHGDSKQLRFEDAMFDGVISNSLIHHVPDPRLVLAEMVRVCKPGGRIFVRDLYRPESMELVESLVQTYTAKETPYNQQLFRQSLCAALTLAEIRQMVSELGFPPESVQMTSDRHWTWSVVK
ncbi:MAG: class I SAM-dependent methyltransferase [Pirellulaceae bacterium]|nr:class I SAM-dependent methyltransferase [Pirellulaceae bacterium]